MLQPPLHADAHGVQGRIRIAVATAAAALVALPAAAHADLPADPLFDRQWALAADAPLRAPEAWQQSTGQGALVAVLDTGVNMAHPDLSGALWTNPGEIPGNGIDDDHDGFVDDVHGADVVNHDGDPADDEGHGTHVAGIIAARANDGEGGSGLAPDATLMIVKVLDGARAGTAADLAAGIEYALAHGARIMNTSVNGDAVSPELRAALADATAAGAIVVASAGNDGRDIDAQPSYPASYPDAGLLTVASEGRGGLLSTFSNRGAADVDVAAPGEDILSTSADGGYELRSGTSMAAPFATATLALMQAARPDLGGPALEAALLGAARRSGPLAGLLGAGELDAAGAVQAVAGQPPAPARAASAPVRLRALKAGRRARGAMVRWVVSGDAARIASVRVTVDGRRALQRRPRGRSRALVRARTGRHRYRILVFDAAGTKLAEARGRFTVRKHRRSALHS
jgi:subtilisin family serine protease